MVTQTAGITALLPAQTLLEVGDFPLEALAAFAMREGRRPRPIYTAHKWFARRLGAVFRALLVGATTSPEEDFWARYYGEADLRGLTVLDPFVGGGTSVVEAQRLGASVAARDVDPIACAVTRLELAAVNLPDLDGALKSLAEDVGQRIRRLHRVTDPEGVDREVLHHFWVQEVDCPECEHSFQVHPHFWLAKTANARVGFCSGCGAVSSIPKGSTLRCACGVLTKLDQGTVHYGKATCPKCMTNFRLIEVGRQTGAPPRWVLFAQEVLESPDGGRAVPMTQRRFLQAGAQAQSRFARALEELREVSEDDRAMGGGPILAAARTDTRLHDYGYSDWKDIYNPRQRLHLILLAKAIGGLEDESVRNALAMAFSDHLTTNCMLTAYTIGWRRLTPVFSVRGFRHVPRPVELNPWLEGTGRGTFPNTIRKLLRAKRFATCPKEPKVEGGFQDVPPRSPEREARVTTGSSTSLAFLPDASVDIVLTDPPYFDNIAYSELAEFFLPWLRDFGMVVDEGVDRVLLDSLVSERGDDDSVATYTQGLQAAFGEVARVLKPGGLMVFSYRHILPEAWASLAEAVWPHPLRCTRVLPMPGEAGVGLHAHDGAGLWDAVFVFRRELDLSRPKGEIDVSEDVVTRVISEASRWRDRLGGGAVRFAAPDERTMRLAGVVGTALNESGSGGSPLLAALRTALEPKCRD